MDMKAVISVLCCPAVVAAYAVTAPMPSSLPYADTEAVTNVTFCAGSCGRKKLEWDIRLDPSLSPKTLRAHVDGGVLPFPMTATLYDPSWDMARVTARGFVNAEAVLKFGATKEPLVIRIR